MAQSVGASAPTQATSYRSRLLSSPEPSVRYHARLALLDEDPASPAMRLAQQEVRTAPRARALLGARDSAGRIPLAPYDKWTGAHWVLARLADLSYPSGDPELIPLRDQVLAWLLGPHAPTGVVIAGRPRRHASIEANALWAIHALGLTPDDGRCDALAASLLAWQWPDGGWNCDKNPTAATSSFMETLIPLRALARHAKVAASSREQAAAQAAVRRAAEVFLTRRLFRRRTDGSVIKPDFVKLHYPCYWHYDILFGLRVLHEAGLLGDSRCEEALDLLESKRLPDGGFPAEAKYWHRITVAAVLAPGPKSGHDLVDWGPVGRTRSNEWVSVRALGVLRAAGRLAGQLPVNRPDGD